MELKQLLAGFNEKFTLFAVFPAIILLGLYLTCRLRCVQISKLKLSASSLLQKGEGNEGSISYYQAISAVLAGNFGTGNISGMAIAISTGGPGALVWMWLMAFLGAAIQYASCILSVMYRKKNDNHEYVGGPMYYLSEGLGMKWLGCAFALFAIYAAFTVGNLAQVNSVILPLKEIGINPLIAGIGIAFFAALVILGGLQRFAKVASSVVPVMAVLYFGTAVLILGLNVEKIFPAFWVMLQAAFNPASVIGGVAGFGVVKAITSGFDRGIFATDAGTGIVPILQSSARTKNPVIDGVVTLIAPFLVMIVCTTTGLVLIVTGAWTVPGLYSTNMVTFAFEQGIGSQVGSYIVILALVLFAFTTILAWSCCAERAVGFLWGRQKARVFQYFYIALIPIGAFLHVDIVWVLADIAISLMLTTNMIGVAGLSRHVIGESRAFFRPVSSFPEIDISAPAAD